MGSDDSYKVYYRVLLDTFIKITSYLCPSRSDTIDDPTINDYNTENTFDGEDYLTHAESGHFKKMESIPSTYDATTEMKIEAYPNTNLKRKLLAIGLDPKFLRLHERGGLFRSHQNSVRRIPGLGEKLKHPNDASQLIEAFCTVGLSSDVLDAVTLFSTVMQKCRSKFEQLRFFRLGRGTSW